jgi:phosphoribosylformylglycinamidine synthase
MVGLLDDRSRAVPMRWTDGDEIWLIGSPGWEPAALAASELAWRRGLFGGRPALDLAAAARAIRLLERLTGTGLLTGAHDLATGGLAVALARLAIASATGAEIRLPDAAGTWPQAALHGERAGRILVATRSGEAVEGAARDADVPAVRLGQATGSMLVVGVGGTSLRWSIAHLTEAWQQDF